LLRCFFLFGGAIHSIVTKKYIPVFYWLVIIMTTTLGTKYLIHGRAYTWDILLAV
jgi:uncharacterized membrane-anchored protein